MSSFDLKNGAIHQFKSGAQEALALRVYKPVVCDCGSAEFLCMRAVKIKHNPLSVASVAIEEAGQRLLCPACGKYAMLENDEQGQPVKWVFKEGN